MSLITDLFANFFITVGHIFADIFYHAFMTYDGFALNFVNMCFYGFSAIILIIQFICIILYIKLIIENKFGG